MFLPSNMSRRRTGLSTKARKTVAIERELVSHELKQHEVRHGKGAEREEEAHGRCLFGPPRIIMPPKIATMKIGERSIILTSGARVSERRTR